MDSGETSQEEIFNAYMAVAAEVQGQISSKVVSFDDTWILLAVQAFYAPTKKPMTLLCGMSLELLNYKTREVKTFRIIMTDTGPGQIGETCADILDNVPPDYKLADLNES